MASTPITDPLRILASIRHVADAYWAFPWLDRPASCTGLATTVKRRRRMRMKRIAQVFAFTAFAALTAVCSRDELQDETDDVVEAQQEAAKVAEENPDDTAAIREAGQEVVDEQREAARE